MCSPKCNHGELSSKVWHAGQMLVWSEVTLLTGEVDISCDQPL